MSLMYIQASSAEHHCTLQIQSDHPRQRLEIFARHYYRIRLVALTIGKGSKSDIGNGHWRKFPIHHSPVWMRRMPDQAYAGTRHTEAGEMSFV